MFLYIYTPNLQHVPFSTMLPAVAILAYAACRHPSAFLLAIKHKRLFSFSVLWFVAIIFVVLVELFSGADSGRRIPDTYPVILARIYIEGMLVATALWAILRTKALEPTEFIIRLLLSAVVLQFVFVALMILFPAWRDYFFSYLAQPIEKLEVGSWRYQSRGFGVASFHLFSYPLFNGLVFFISAWMAITRNYWYLLLSLMALLPVFLNARIGLIFVAIFLLSLLFAVVPRVSTRALGRYFLVATIGIGSLAFGVIFVVSIGLVPATVVNWIGTGLQEYAEIAVAGESGTLNTLLASHWHLPSGISIVTGEGRYLYQTSTYAGISSDIGYINFLFYGGLFFSLLVYGAFLVLALGSIRPSSNLLERCIVGAILCGLAVAHFKGIIFGANPFMKAVILLLVAFALDKRRSTTTGTKRLRLLLRGEPAGNRELSAM